MVLDAIDEITNHIQFDKYLGAIETSSTQLRIGQKDAAAVWAEFGSDGGLLCATTTHDEHDDSILLAFGGLREDAASYLAFMCLRGSIGAGDRIRTGDSLLGRQGLYR